MGRWHPALVLARSVGWGLPCPHAGELGQEGGGAGKAVCSVASVDNPKASLDSRGDAKTHEISERKLCFEPQLRAAQSQQERKTRGTEFTTHFVTWSPRSAVRTGVWRALVPGVPRGTALRAAGSERRSNVCVNNGKTNQERESQHNKYERAVGAAPACAQTPAAKAAALRQLPKGTGRRAQRWTRPWASISSRLEAQVVQVAGGSRAAGLPAAPAHRPAGLLEEE